MYVFDNDNICVFSGYLGIKLQNSRHCDSWWIRSIRKYLNEELKYSLNYLITLAMNENDIQVITWILEDFPFLK